MLIVALVLVFLDIFDLLDSLAVIPVLGLGHSSGNGKTEDKTQGLHLEMAVWVVECSWSY